MKVTGTAGEAGNTGTDGPHENERTADRVNRILAHPVFLEKLAKLHELERDRPFCRHGMEHLLDVARLSMILFREDGGFLSGGQSFSEEESLFDGECPFGGKSLSGEESPLWENPREILYGTALLHDIGRGRQYRDKTPHEEEGRRLAPSILADCGYTQREILMMAEAIGMHRKPEVASQPGLAGILYRADKMSRSCFSCPMERKCDWKEGKKNRRLVY